LESASVGVQESGSKPKAAVPQPKRRRKRPVVEA
jgi:hypothetical protein